MVLAETVPALSETLIPPLLQGAAKLAALVAQGVHVERILTCLSGPFSNEAALQAASFDTAVLSFLSDRPDLGLALQADVLRTCSVFRMAPGCDAESHTAPPLRLLALAAPGDLQMNMPIEFITEHLNVRLDIVFVLPDQPLPAVLPDHDVAICVVSDSNPATLARLAPMLTIWPRPVLNNPATIAGGNIDGLARDGVARLFAASLHVLAPTTVACTRAEIVDFLAAGAPLDEFLPEGAWPLLVRPVGSHAGRLLERLNDRKELGIYLASLSADQFYLSSFVDYRDTDGFFRKSRIALVQGQAFLCHMAVSDHWMIHYLNAGMTESAAKRADEARAMAAFDAGFACRHGAALAELHDALGLDYVLLDCAEAPDGRLLLFEVEMAAIIHLLDPVDMFPYKQAPMRRVFAAFSAMLTRAVQPASTVSRIISNSNQRSSDDASSVSASLSALVARS